MTFAKRAALGVDPKLDMIRILMIGRSAGGGNDERNSFFTLAGSAIVNDLN